MNKTIIVSNRLPVKIVENNNSYELKPSEGGLATGLSSFLGEGNKIWIGWPGMEIPEDKQREVVLNLGKQHLVPVFLSQEEIKQYYEGFSNETLWPVFHYMSTYANFDKTYWDYYVQVNEKFKQEVLPLLAPGDTLWIHDYQLLLLPSLIRKEMEHVAIGFFLHIPFPSFELFRLIPWRSELLSGILGADLIGFHTHDDVMHFVHTVDRLLPAERSSRQIFYNDHSSMVDAFPMGIDFEKFEKLLNDRDVLNSLAQLQMNFQGLEIVLSIDRLDYSKGILQRLQAFDLFLQSYSQYVGKVSLYMIVVPSRDAVPQYKELKDGIDKLVGNINARYRTNDWTPIHYFYRSFSVEELSALYQFSKVCLVTPMRDGMNLVCKEYIASRKNNDGVLILSEMAGAAKELLEAIIVNPNNVWQMSQSIYAALNMPVAEQEQRMQQLREQVKRNNVFKWVETFLQKLKEMKQTQLALQTRTITPRLLQYIKNKYQKAQKRLFLLDYDGTLVPFQSNIDLATPDKELYEILENLLKEDSNRVVIISGRKRSYLEEWFGNLKLDLIAEHGAWTKLHNGKWEQKKGLRADWKKEILPILQAFAEKTPGSFIEEKSFSLVWHYRMADTELGEIRAAELMNNLRYIVNNYGLNLMPGNKIVEVKNIEINKGDVVLNYLQNNFYDFVFAVGDDLTDEDMFHALLNYEHLAITIKVNGNYSSARYCVKDYKEVRNILKQLSAKNMVSKWLDKFIESIPANFSRKK